MPRKGRFGGASVVQMGKRKMQVLDFQALAFCWVPGAGIEPARIAPLVFETSASTDSAIRAGALMRTCLSCAMLNWSACKGLQIYRNFRKLQNNC